MKQREFIYVLHFPLPLGRSQHYLGSTRSLKKRLEYHAAGHGSALTRALHALGHPWSLGGLYEVRHAHLSRVEQWAKAQHNGPRFCGICSEHPDAMINSVPYPVEILPFPIHSRLITPPTALGPIRVRATTPNDSDQILKFVLQLMQNDDDALGFIPVGGRDGLNRYKTAGNLLIIENDADPVGYAAISRPADGAQVNIHQICIRADARLLQHGRALVRFIQASYPDAETVAKVRQDLPACDFWRALGYQRRRIAAHKTSGSTLAHYHHHPLLERTPKCQSSTNTKMEEPTKSTTEENEPS